jgi:hypothetical protein
MLKFDIINGLFFNNSRPNLSDENDFLIIRDSISTMGFF